jgi:hypothetical protein
MMLSRLWSEVSAVIFTGAFGSGKTEVAISYALAALRAGAQVCLMDFDIVTPYFRVGDYREELIGSGLRVVAPEGKLASFELPALSPEIRGAMADKSLHLVVDVGGDAEGARLLRGYEDLIRARSREFLIVVNPFRPTTASPEAIGRQAREIEAACEMEITGLVANPNLGPETQVEEVMQGLAVVRRAAAELAHPVVMLAIAPPLASEVGSVDVPLLPIVQAVRLPWQERRAQGSDADRRS